MSKITVNRISGYSNAMRKIKLVLNNQVVETIKDGEMKTINLTPGKYKLKAKIDWCRSNEIEFDISEGETKKVKLQGTSPFYGIYYITFGFNKYLKLEEID